MKQSNPNPPDAGVKSPQVEWGVRFSASPNHDRVTVCCDKPAAVRFLGGLCFCGNRDAVLVARADSDAAWIPQAPHTTVERAA